MLRRRDVSGASTSERSEGTGWEDGGCRAGLGDVENWHNFRPPSLVWKTNGSGGVKDGQAGCVVKGEE